MLLKKNKETLTHTIQPHHTSLARSATGVSEEKETGRGTSAQQNDRNPCANKLELFIAMSAADGSEAEVALRYIDVDQLITDLDLTPPCRGSRGRKVAAKRKEGRCVYVSVRPSVCVCL